MTVRQLIPEGLAEMKPGPELSALLAGIDIHALTGFDLVEVLQARMRQLSYEQAQVLATMVEVGLCAPRARGDDVTRLAEPAVYAGDEIRAALAWTRRAAERELSFAESLVRWMPAVFTALETGVICRSKAWVFTDLCAELTSEQTDVVCTRLLPRAGRLTPGELAARIKKLAIALDPEWAARRYATAVRERNVIGYLDPDGTATITGTGLPVEEAASACARVEELARAAKRAGHRGRIGALRTDIYLGLLDGRWQHHTREQIIADLLTTDTEAGADSDPSTTPAPDRQTPVSEACPGAPTDTAPAANPHDPADPAATRLDAAPATDPASDAAPLARRVGVEVRVGLSTLLGRDEHPGEIPGWGMVPAEIARVMVTAQRAAELRYAITDPTGQLLLAGITRCRPHDHPASECALDQPPPCRGGIVELQLPATLLADLVTNPEACGPWAGIVTDLAAQYTRYIQDGWRGLDTQDPTARFAGTALRRHVQIRDRYCVHVGCRASAERADLDHTVDHALGGTTAEANSGPLCKHDHLLKHEGGWQLYQSDPGYFTWISPLGRVYRTQPPPITDDWPDPRPRPEHPEYPFDATPDDDGPILERPPPQPDPPPPAKPPDPDEPPPF